MGEFVTLQTADGIGTVRLDRPPMNPLSKQVQEELRAAVAEAAADEAVRAVVFTGGPGIPGPRYSSFTGQPHSAQLNWYPTFTSGSYTGQTQAAWSITRSEEHTSELQSH